jgi:hypothetical protein
MKNNFNKRKNKSKNESQIEKNKANKILIE